MRSALTRAGLAPGALAAAVFVVLVLGLGSLHLPGDVLHIGRHSSGAAATRPGTTPDARYADGRLQPASGNNRVLVEKAVAHALYAQMAYPERVHR